MRKNAAVYWPSLAVTLTFCFLFILTRTSTTAMRIPINPQSANLTLATNQQQHRKERLQRSTSETEDDYDAGDAYSDYDDQASDQQAGREIGISDASNGYYDFIINEGSYKFWAAFQIFTAALLIYSGFAAVYYAKYNYEPPALDDADQDILFRRRSGDAYVTPSPNASSIGLNKETFQRIMNAIASKEYS